jgi:hypothetical protein
MSEPIKDVEVILVCENHNHNGKDCKKGDKLKVTPAQQKWLKEQKLI